MKKYLVMIIIILTTYTVATENKIQCRKVLNSCAKTVESQKKTIDSSKKLVKIKEEKINFLEKRNDQVQKDLESQRSYTLGSILMFLLLL